MTLASNLITDTGMEPAGGTSTPTGMEPAGGARAASEIHEVVESPEKAAPAAGSASAPEIGQGSDQGATRILELLEEPQLEPTLPETVPGEDGQQLGATVAITAVVIVVSGQWPVAVSGSSSTSSSK